jgi:hypothetical protein
VNVRWIHAYLGLCREGGSSLRREIYVKKQGAQKEGREERMSKGKIIKGKWRKFLNECNIYTHRAYMK